MLLQMNGNLHNKIWIKWDGWPSSSFSKHLKINILQIKLPFRKEMSEMSEVLNIPNCCPDRRTLELILNAKFTCLKTVHLISAYPFCSILLAVLGRAESDVLLFSHLTWPMLHFGSLWYTPGFPSSTWAVWTSVSPFLRPCSPPESQWSQHLLYFILCIMINMQSSEELSFSDDELPKHSASAIFWLDWKSQLLYQY